MFESLPTFSVRAHPGKILLSTSRRIVTSLATLSAQTYKQTNQPAMETVKPSEMKRREAEKKHVYSASGAPLGTISSPPRTTVSTPPLGLKTTIVFSGTGVPIDTRLESPPELPPAKTGTSPNTRPPLPRKRSKRSQRSKGKSRDKNTSSTPTILCWLIQRGKYEDATERLHETPQEASIWWVERPPGDDAAVSRALPIHLACRKVAEETDEAARARLGDFLSHLLLIYPQGARMRDDGHVDRTRIEDSLLFCNSSNNSNNNSIRSARRTAIPVTGRLPVHDAVAGGVDEETLALFLTVYPESIYSVDERRLSLSELNRLATNDPNIQGVLDLGYEDWKSAYESSPLSGRSASKMDDLVSCASEARNADISASTPICLLVDEGDELFPDNVSALTTPDELLPSGNNVWGIDRHGEKIEDKDKEEVSSEHDVVEEAKHETKPEQNSPSSDPAPIVTWEQIEERALALERVLGEMKTKNYDLHEKIQVLSKDQGREIILRVDRSQKTDLYGMVDVLQHQNFALDQNIYKTETLLHYSVFPSDEESVGRQRRRGEIARMLGWLDVEENDKSSTIEDSSDEEKVNDTTLQQIYNELHESYDQQKAAIKQFGFVFEKLGINRFVDEDNASADTVPRSVVSNLTVNSDDWSFGSDHCDDVSRPERSRNVLREVEIEWPEDSVDACQVSDNLSTIFRHAAAITEENEDCLMPTSSGGHNFGVDNLSQILRSAAAKETRRKKVKRMKPVSQELTIPALMPEGGAKMLPAIAGSLQHTKSIGSFRSASKSSLKQSFFTSTTKIYEVPSVLPEAPVKSPSLKSTISAERSCHVASACISDPIRPRSIKSSEDPKRSDSESKGSGGGFRRQQRRPSLMDGVTALAEKGRLHTREHNDQQSQSPSHLQSDVTDLLTPDGDKNGTDNDHCEHDELKLSDRKPPIVSFNTVSIRVYDRILSDNPAAASGPSLGIGWVFVPQDVKSVDDFEILREPMRAPERLLLTRQEREQVFFDLGYTQKDVAVNVRELNKLRSQRRRTIVNLGSTRVEETVEVAKRKLKSILRLKRSSPLETSAKNLLSSTSTNSTTSSSKDKEKLTSAIEQSTSKPLQLAINPI